MFKYHNLKSGMVLECKKVSDEKDGHEVIGATGLPVRVLRHEFEVVED